MSRIPDLSVCIVNHRTPDLTVACVRSVYRAAGQLAVEVLLVNNTSEPCDVADAVPFGAPYTFIQNERSLGYAANQNLMLLRAQAPFRMALNSDTLVAPGALATLVDFMQAHPRCGICGPKLVYPDGRLQPSARNFPGFISGLLEASGAWRMLGPSRLAGALAYLADPHDVPLRPDWLSGACLVVRAEAMAQVGALDSAMFPYLFAEDLEWQWRMHGAGWENWLVPDAQVVHLESQSPADSRLEAQWSGTRAFLGRHYPPLRRALVVLGLLKGYAMRWLLAPGPATRAAARVAIRLILSRPSAP